MVTQLLEAETGIVVQCSFLKSLLPALHDGLTYIPMEHCIVWVVYRMC